MWAALVWRSAVPSRSRGSWQTSLLASLVFPPPLPALSDSLLSPSSSAKWWRKGEEAKRAVTSKELAAFWGKRVFSAHAMWCEKVLQQLRPQPGCCAHLPGTCVLQTLMKFKFFWAFFTVTSESGFPSFEVLPSSPLPRWSPALLSDAAVLLRLLPLFRISEQLCPSLSPFPGSSRYNLGKIIQVHG